MTDHSEMRNQLFDQFSKAVLDRGWRSLSCADIATDAGFEVKQAFVAFPNRYAYVTELIRRIDRSMLEVYDVEMKDEPARDRLFDVIMARFEAMQDHRDVIVALTHATRTDPLLSLHLMGLSRLTADWFLEVARISPVGVRGIMRSKGALAAYARAFRVWLDDDSEDLSRTMAALDKFLKTGEKALRRAEKLACMLPRMGARCRSRRASSTPSEPSTGASSVTPGPSVDDGTMAPMPS